MNTVEKRVRGMLLGAAVGDAMGLAAPHWPPAEPTRKYPLGDWSLHTDMLIAAMKAALRSDMVLTDDERAEILSLEAAIIDELDKWAKSGHSELGDKGPAVGLSGSLRTTIADPQWRDRPREVAHAIWDRSGGKLALNGGMSRALALGAINAMRPPPHDLSTDRLIMLASFTHCDMRSVLSSVWLTHLVAIAASPPSDLLPFIDIAKLMEDETVAPTKQATKQQCPLAWMLGAGKSLSEGVAELSKNVPQQFAEVAAATVDQINTTATTNAPIADLRLGDLGRAAAALKTVSAAAYVIRALDHAYTRGVVPSFEKIVRHVAAAGGDTAMNCMMAGALVGLYNSDIDARLTRHIPHYEWYSALVDRFIGGVSDMLLVDIADAMGVLDGVADTPAKSSNMTSTSSSEGISRDRGDIDTVAAPTTSASDEPTSDPIDVIVVHEEEEADRDGGGGISE